MSCQCVCDTCQSGDHCDSATCALPNPPKFLVGQRVIVVRGFLGDKPATHNHIGYYGHVVTTQTPEENRVLESNMCWVKMIGRVGAEAAPWMLTDTWFNPFCFFEDQLEAAD